MASELLLNTGKQGIDKSPVIRSLDLVLSGSGHSGMLTSNTTEHWKAVRKGVAPAFSTANIRCRAAATLALSTYCIFVDDQQARLLGEGSDAKQGHHDSSTVHENASSPAHETAGRDSSRRLWWWTS